MIRSPGARLGPYEILSPLGTGGMGEVYKARDTRLDRTVAIKVVSAAAGADPEFRARLEQEARAISQLDHPHICALYDVGEDEGVPFLVMQYLEGETLEGRLSRGPLPLDQALRCGIEIAGALAAAHHAGITHRDLKPANVMLTRSGAKLLDFGLAKLHKTDGVDDPTVADLTTPGTVLGTIRYMAPEQLEGRDADARTDIFALGLILYEMLAGRHAFEGSAQATAIGAILHVDPPPPSRFQPLVAPVLDHIVMRCLAKDPADRWQTADDVMHELRWAGEHASASGEAATSTAAVRGRSRRERAAWAVAAVLAIAAAGAWLTSHPRAPVPQPMVRFPVAPPDHAVFPSGGNGGWGSPLAVSPDGRRIVFVVSEPKGAQGLWMRTIDDTVLRPLGATEGASGPFWSPDGQWIAFFADSKLKRLPVNGGDPQVLCDAGGGAGGSWSRDGVILFQSVGAGEGGLLRVPASGGTPVQATTLDPAHGETNHLWPQFLPDGRHYLYIVWGRDDSGLYVGSLDSSTRTRLVERTPEEANLSPVEYVQPGYLLFLRGRALWAQPFDADALTLHGDAFQVADGVLSEGPGSTAFSAASTVLAFWSGAVPPESRLTWLLRNGQPAGTVGPPGPYFGLALAPGGRTIALDTFDPNERIFREALWVMDVDRAVPQKFTFGAGAHAPVWADDGVSLSYESSAGGPPILYRKRLDGSRDAERIVETVAGGRPNDWSSDGRTLIYQTYDPSRQWDLWDVTVGDRSSATPLLQSSFNELGARLSPDGRWMAYVSDETGTAEVYVTSFPGVRGKWRISTDGGNGPEWRRDGRELYYVSATHRLMAVPIRVGQHPEIGAPVPLFDLPRVPLAPEDEPALEEHQYAPSSDGQRFLVRVPVGEAQLPPATVVLNWTGLKR
jgi:Tol biopolymer transport system component